MGVDFFPKTFQLSDGSIINCLIYDTAGQERYKAITETYYKRADAVLLVYDISDQKSFKEIKDYYCPNIKEFCKKNIPIILLGNKADMENKRQVPIEDGVKLAVNENFKFKETSCLKNENVAGAFEALVEMWNFEYQKNLPKPRSNSGEKKKSKMSNKKKNDDNESFNNCYTLRNSVFLSSTNFKEDMMNIEEDDMKNQRFSLQPNMLTNKNHKKKKCC